MQTELDRALSGRQRWWWWQAFLLPNHLVKEEEPLFSPVQPIFQEVWREGLSFFKFFQFVTCKSLDEVCERSYEVRAIDPSYMT